jgi:hypothetical protein
MVFSAVRAAILRDAAKTPLLRMRLRYDDLMVRRLAPSRTMVMRRPGLASSA